MSTVDRIAVQKNTDQLNFEDFLGGLTRIVKIAGVSQGRKEAQYDIAIEGDDRYWRPPATVLKQLVLAYGDKASEWAGKYAELYGDPEVKMKGKNVGGIRVSRLSHIDKPLTAHLTITRGQTGTFTVDPLPLVEALKAEWRTATPERRAEIEAEVAAMNAPATTGQPDTDDAPTDGPHIPGVEG